MEIGAARAVAILAAAMLLIPSAVSGECRPTLTNIEGPYYVPGAPLREDLVPEASEGERLLIEGTVFAADCRTPLKGATVELWQAGPDGSYDFSKEFLWRGQAKTDEKGRYAFRTVVPGRYGDGRTFRPAHLHLKISHDRGRTLVTQVYFKGDPYIATDPFVKKSLVISLDRFREKGVPRYRGVFDIVLAQP